jgi:hypothetical protein
VSDYAYDALERLNTAQGAFGTRDYDYDKNGNRTLVTADSVATGYAYAPASNRLSLVGSDTVTLDANGNTVAQGARSFTYNAHNRLLTASNGGALVASYTYNGLKR